MGCSSTATAPPMSHGSATCLTCALPTTGPDAPENPDEPSAHARPCPYCGGRMIVIEVFEAGCKLRHRTTPEGIDSS